MERGRINMSGGRTGAETSINGLWVWKGPWASGTVYHRGQAVSNAGSSWVAIRQTSSKPNTTDGTWQLVALRGEDGTPGIIWTGAFDNGRQYNVGEAVYFGGSAYINIAPSQNIEPTNPAYWSILVRSLNPGGVLNLVIGPDDSIQEAIDTVADAGGGTVVLQGGTYEVDYDIRMRSLVHLRAEGVLTATIDFMGTHSSLLFEGEEIYATGTVSAVGGSDVITGAGTQFLDDVEPGQEIFLGGIFYPIVDVISNTELQVGLPLVESFSGVACRIAEPISFATVESIGFTNSTNFAMRSNYAAEIDVSVWAVSLCGGVIEYKNTTNIKFHNGDGVGNAQGIVFDNAHLADASAVGVLHTAFGSGVSFINGSANIAFKDNFILSQAEHGIHVQDSGPLFFSGVTTTRSGQHGIFVERSGSIIFSGVKTIENAGDGVHVKDSLGTIFNASAVNSNVGASFLINANSAETIINGSNIGPSMGGVLVDNGVDTMVAGCIPENINTGGGAGDMLASVYDPAGGAKQVAFESDVDSALNLKADTSALTAHTSNTSNPHSVTKAQVGLGNVDNTSDANKPISTATQSALNNKENTINAGTTSQYLRGDKTWQALNKGAVGLGNVDNTSDANKPVSTAQQSALNDKVDKVSGKGLSSEDYTTSEKNKLAGIEAGAEANVQSDWNASSGVAEILNKPTLGTMAAEDASDYTKTANLGALASKDEVEISDIDATGTPSGTTYLAGDGTWKTPAGGGSGIQTIQEGTGIDVNSTDPANPIVGLDSATQTSLGKADSAVQPGTLADVATSGDYDDLDNKPTIPAAQVNSDWDAASGVAEILNKPTLGTLASEDDAPNDGKQYAREDGEWTEVTGGGGSSPWDANAELDGGIKYDGGDLLVGDSMEGAGAKMFFNATKAAFRAGNVGTQWNDANVGTYSTAFGQNTTASGNYSAAFGRQTTAQADYSFVLGQYNVVAGGSFWIATDPLFVIGNGASAGARSNALTVLKNATLGINTHEPDLSSILDLTATDRGFLPPRMTEAQRDAITSPAEGLVVYNTDENALNLFDGSAWVDVGGGGGGGAGDMLASVYDPANGAKQVAFEDDVDSALNAKQATLVSGTNIKTINGTSVLGSGNIATPNTTYTEITETEITAGTASTLRTISGRRAQVIVNKAVATVQPDINSKAPLAQTVGSVVHNNNASMARPTNYKTVIWYGIAEPVNKLPTDQWIDINIT